MHTNVRILAALLLAASGCVSQGAYDDMKKSYDEAAGKLTTANTSYAALEASHETWRTKATQLEAELGQTQRALAVLRANYEAELGAAGEQKVALEKDLAAQREQLAQTLKDKNRLRESTQQLQQALQELAQRKAQAEARVAEARGLLARFKPLIDAGTLRVTMDAGRMVLALPSDVLFDTGSARLSKVGRAAIAEVALVLREDFKDRRFQVEGHTDNVPIHNAQYASNWELASARSLGVVKLMAEQGMQPQALSAASHGENHPAMPNDTEAGRAYNRRIEIIIVPDLSSLPGFEELTRAVERS